MDSALEAARTLVHAADEVVRGALARLARDSVRDGRVDLARLDREQVLAYDLATVAAMVRAAEDLLDWGAGGTLQRDLALAFAGHVAAEVGARTQGRHPAWAVDELPWRTGPAAAAFDAARAPALLERIADDVVATPDLPREAGEELELARRTFRDFTDAKVTPVAEAIHRDDRDVPEELITELGGMGAFGLSIPQGYGGFAADEDDRAAADLLAMVVVTEELSRGSLGAAGSLITRPEILAQALLAGGTEEQKRRWLPPIAAGERMCAVAVTEPDHGSDVARLATTAVRDGDGYVVHGVKTWCTFAGRAELLMLLARTGSPAEGHRGLSLFVVEKPAYPGHEWVAHDGRGGRVVARAIGTIGYRGMHSFELSFEDYRVPATNLVGGEAGVGRGFYLQLGAFANGRLQTAARALGVMQAAFEDAAAYTAARHVFGVPLAAYQLSRAKLATMAYLIAACRSFTHRTATRLGAGRRAAGSGGGPGELEAAMAKSLACRAAEWITREAQQLHGGYGYAEEYAVSRYFVDARVLPLFEGADETLALRMIIRGLLTDAVDAPR